MAIPETQFETWSHIGSIDQSSSTYQIIRSALLSNTALYADKSFEVFLQGSYGNNTNIRAESDVDIVIRLDSIFRGDITDLSSEQQFAYQQFLTGSPATYTIQKFKEGVITRLSTAFTGDQVKSENKSIKIRSNGSRRSADVIPCFEYRKFTRFISQNDCDFISGIIFPTLTSGEIINYPKIHLENCTIKHQATNSWFKPIIRIFKNMRTRLIDGGLILKDTAPSYYIEGMLYNVPNTEFGVSYCDTFCKCFNWLRNINRSQLLCANGQHLLIGNSNVQWSSIKYDQFLTSIATLWSNY